MNSQEKTQELMSRLKKKYELEGQVKELNKAISKDTEELHEIMTDEGVDSVEIDGVKFSPKVEQDFALSDDLKGKKWDDIGVWHNWLKEVGEGGLIKTKSTVPANTRKKFLKDWVEEQKPLPNFIEEKFFNTVKYSAAAIRRLVNGS